MKAHLDQEAHQDQWCVKVLLNTIHSICSTDICSIFNAQQSLNPDVMKDQIIQRE